MSSYYKAEDVQRILCGWCGVCANPTVEDLLKCDDICPEFAQIPAADVRPVVMCRDCKNSEPWYADKLRCFLWNESGIDVFNDGFCNYGKKREEGVFHG